MASLLGFSAVPPPEELPEAFHAVYVSRRNALEGQEQVGEECLDCCATAQGWNPSSLFLSHLVPASAHVDGLTRIGESAFRASGHYEAIRSSPSNCGENAS